MTVPYAGHFLIVILESCIHRTTLYHDNTCRCAGNYEAISAQALELSLIHGMYLRKACRH